MRRVEVLPDQTAIAARAAELLHQAVQENGNEFTVALSGGTTPKLLYRMLAAEPWINILPWSQIRWFFGDERFVPETSDQSNYRMANENLLQPAGINMSHVFRVRTELGSPEAAAADYERQVLSNVPASSAGETPAFNLVLLGMGDDGHTASLFPDTAALKEESKAVVSNYVEKLDAWRITLTRPVLAAAKRTVIMVTGAEKAQALSAVLEGEKDETRYPSQLLNSRSGETIWLVDRAAASQLKSIGPQDRE